jgi:hypothetical protein
MATDFNRIRQLVTALIDIGAMQGAFAETGAQAPTISISFSVNHPQVGTAADPSTGAAASADYRAAFTEQFAFNFTLPPDVASTAATALAGAVTSAMSAMNLPTS